MTKRMFKRRTKTLILVHSLDEIPVFNTEDEERDWWGEHELSDKLWDSLPKVGPHDRALRLEAKPASEPDGN